MANPTYATSADLEASPWNISPVPSNADRLLGTASRLVRWATATGRYATDDSGAPTDPDLLAAFKEATCAQVAQWVALAVDPLQGRAQSTGKGSVSSKSLGSGSISYDVSSSAAEYAAKSLAAQQLGFEARLILSDCGLLLTRPGATR